MYVCAPKYVCVGVYPGVHHVLGSTYTTIEAFTRCTYPWRTQGPSMAESGYQVSHSHAAASSKWKAELRELRDMGFSKERAQRALEETNGDISAALGRLL